MTNQTHVRSLIDLLEDALHSPSGRLIIKRQTPQEGAAFRLRLYRARAKLRKQNERLDPTHPLHGRTPYDELAIKLAMPGPDGEPIVYNEKGNSFKAAPWVVIYHDLALNDTNLDVSY